MLKTVVPAMVFASFFKNLTEVKICSVGFNLLQFNAGLEGLEYTHDNCNHESCS